MKWPGKAAAMLLPWPSRHQRQAAVDVARAEKEQSQAGAAHAAAIERDIERMAAVNHFADSLRASLIRGYRDREAG